MTAAVVAVAALAAVAIFCLTALRAWRGWLELKTAELGQRRDQAADNDVGVRIELAAVRERLKKLEAIASGVEL